MKNKIFSIVILAVVFLAISVLVFWKIDFSEDVDFSGKNKQILKMTDTMDNLGNNGGNDKEASNTLRLSDEPVRASEGSSSGGEKSSGSSSSSGGSRNDQPLKNENSDDKSKAGISVSLSGSTYTEGETFAAYVEISSDKEIYAVEFELDFDAEILELISVEKGDFLSKDGAETYEVVRRKDGKVIFGSTRIKTQEGVSGQGNLLVIEFKAENPGTSDLTLSNIQIADPSLDADKFEVSINNSKATVS